MITTELSSGSRTIAFRIASWLDRFSGDPSGTWVWSDSRVAKARLPTRSFVAERRYAGAASMLSDVWDADGHPYPARVTCCRLTEALRSST